MSKMFEMLRDGLQEAIEHEQGKKNLKKKRVLIPEAPRSYNASSIKKLRKKHDFSQQELALWVNVSLNTVEAWEQGLRNPSHSALRILEILEKGFDDIQKIFKLSNEDTSHVTYSKHPAPLKVQRKKKK